ncbi:MFS transporter [Sporolactobacillus sp. STSJ-5]|uniref:MFS transporter n=1 Tax=Sporolactobacillus sp. STSJ-5 TaxID=2965076 RepID=UPI002104B8D9|nr:MFS transporter [Sporolactobacillus sp. STSJ-5]
MKKQEKKQKTVFIILLSNIFIAFLGIGLIIPVMPSFMDAMHLSGQTMGYLVATFAAAQFLMSPLTGGWIDRFGRKKAIIIGLFFFSISELIFGLGTNIGMLYFSRILGGVGAAFIMPGATAYVADITTVEERPKAMGYVSAAISTGFIIGPGIGGFLATYGVRTPFFFAAVVAFLACISSLLMLSETMPREQSAENPAHTQENTGFISDVKKSFHPLYLIAFVIVFVLSFGLSVYETIFSLFTDHRFGYTAQDIAMIFTISSIVGLIVQVSMFGKMVKVLGEKKLIQLCLVAGVLLAVVSTMVSNFFIVLAVTCAIFLAFDLLRPALTTLLSKTADDQEQGFVAGMNSTYTSLGNIIGPAMGGLLFDWNINFPYLFAAIIMAIGFGMTFKWKNKHVQPLNHIKSSERQRI